MKPNCTYRKIVFHLFFLLIIISLAVPDQAGLTARLYDVEDPDDKEEQETEPSRTFALEGVAPKPSGGPDYYGYTWSVTDTYNWDDISATGTDSGLWGDDEFSDPIVFPGGFTFQFYENTYSSFYISTNGLISFGSGTNKHLDRPMPFDGAPQNFIAPFWDDLNVEKEVGAKVLYQLKGDKFIIQWHNVIRHGVPEHKLTFQVVLDAQGKICFQYKDLNGDLNYASVGIEDADGVDGLTYLSNENGLENLEGQYALCFSRPENPYRVKVLPAYQGKFALRNNQTSTAEFKVDIKNIGDYEDTYELSVSNMNSNWRYELLNSDRSALKNTNSIPGIDTGKIPKGSTKSIIVKLTSIPNLAEGEYVKPTLNIKSTKDQSVIRQVVLQTAVPTSFAQSLSKSSGVDLHLISNHRYQALNVDSSFTGSSFALNSMPDGSFMYVWEENVDEEDPDKSYTNLKYALLSNYGTRLTSNRDFTNNSSQATPSMRVDDRSPSLAVTSTGLVGVVWVREQINLDTSAVKSNVFFSIINPANPGVPVRKAQAITTNNNWRTEAKLEVPLFYKPRIAATSHDAFVITWVDTREKSPELSNIHLAIYPSNGAGPIRNGASVTDTEAGKYLFQDPAIIGLQDGRAFLAYIQYTTGSSGDQYQIHYQIFDSKGENPGGDSAIPGASGWLPDVIQLKQKNILVAWTGSTTGQIEFSLVNPDTLVASTPVILQNPNNRVSDRVSLAVDDNQNGILTWIDTDLSQQLYYALVNPEGGLLTEPISFLSVTGNDKLLVTDTGCGATSYRKRFFINLPLVNR